MQICKLRTKILSWSVLAKQPVLGRQIIQNLCPQKQYDTPLIQYAIYSLIQACLKPRFRVRLAQKQCLRNFVTFFSPFQELFCQFFGQKTFKTACLWSLVVALEWGSILQEWGKWSGAKKLEPIGRNMSKKRVGSKCAPCLHRVINLFLDASSHLYKRFCPQVRLSVTPFQ